MTACRLLGHGNRFRQGRNCNIRSLKKVSQAHDDVFAAVLTQQAALPEAEQGRRPAALTSCGGVESVHTAGKTIGRITRCIRARSMPY